VSISNDSGNSLEPSLFLYPPHSHVDAYEFNGQLMAEALIEWVLPHSSPGISEITMKSALNRRYATQVFASAKTKFILLLPDCFRKYAIRPAGAKENSHLVSALLSVSKSHKKDHIFSYAFEMQPELADFFELPFDAVLVPTILAYDPSTQYKYKSAITSLECGAETKEFEALLKREVSDYVESVRAGNALRIIRSESTADEATSEVCRTSTVLCAMNYLLRIRPPPSYVVRAVGSTVEPLVNAPGKCTVLAVLNSALSDCEDCQYVEPVLDLLSRAAAPDSRLTVAKIDAANNDVPSNWGVSAYPSLLWFCGKSKENSSPIGFSSGRSNDFGIYAASGKLISLQEMVIQVSNLARSSLGNVRLASPDQFSMLMMDFDSTNSYYESIYAYRRRNAGRVVQSSPYVDAIVGEVVFDGKLWHLGIVILAFICGLLIARPSSFRTQSACILSKPEDPNSDSDSAAHAGGEEQVQADGEGESEDVAIITADNDSTVK
jgi:hypothetical protein